MAIILACDITTLTKNAACFNNCWTTLDNQAALVYLMEQRRAALAGVTPLTAAQLRKNAACFCIGPDPIADGLDVAVAQEGAILAGAPGAAALTISQLRAASNAFRNMTLSELRNMEILTRCALQSF